MCRNPILITVFIFVLFLAGVNPVMAVENSHSEQSDQVKSDAMENHSAPQSHIPGQSAVTNGQGHNNNSGGHDSSSGINASHDGQTQSVQAESHGNEHSNKPVKEVNIKPWVNTFLVYIAGVLVFALIFKKGKGSNSNELVR